MEPEVAGELGDQSELDTSCHPPIVRSLHYVFQGWLGDDLVESFPCFLVSKRLAYALAKRGMSGFTVRLATITTSPEFRELNPGVTLPEFLWLVVDGDLGRSDFAIAEDHRLIVSDRALEVIRSFRLAGADVEPYILN